MSYIQQFHNIQRWSLRLVWLGLLCILTSPVVAQVDCPTFILMVGQRQQVLEIQTGILYETSLDGYLVRDAEWDSTSQTVYFLGYPEDSTPEAMALYKLTWDTTEPESISDFKTELEMTDVEVSPDGKTLAIGVVTEGAEPLDYGVGIVLYDIETDEMRAITEIAVNGETRGTLSLLDMEWSPTGDLLALTTMIVGPEETTGLLEAACLQEGNPVCEVKLLLPDVNRGYFAPTWSPDGGMLAFRCLHAGSDAICMWDVFTEQVSEIDTPFITRHDLDWLPCDQQFVSYISENDPNDPILLIFDLDIAEALFSMPFDRHDFRELVVIPETPLPRWVTHEVTETPEPED